MAKDIQLIVSQVEYLENILCLLYSLKIYKSCFHRGDGFLCVTKGVAL